ncbi:hypothetical protein LOTGIDRAFT_139149, partial [Lottia gigantea]
VNVEKTKMVVFRKGIKLPKHCTWLYDSKPIEVVNSFNYLGVNLFYNGKFVKAQLIISSQGRKCMFNILNICNKNSLNIEAKLNVFDSYVSPVLNYGCEIWGFR